MSATPLPPCIFCERNIKPMEPIVPTSFLFPPGGEGSLVGSASLHLTCFIQTIAGETARAVLHSIKSGEVDIGLERESNDPLDGVVGEILSRTIESFTRRR